MNYGEAKRALLAESIETGARLRSRLEQALLLLKPMLPFDAASLEAFDRSGGLATDALLLRFNNMVSLVQDHLLRATTSIEHEPTKRRSKREERDVAEMIGALDPTLPFDAIVAARNRIAHQYPIDPGKQSEIINEVAAAAPALIAMYDGFARYASSSFGI